MKTCVECKWHKPSPLSGQFDMCMQPKILEKEIDLVSGRPQSYCSVARRDWGWSATDCGPKGKYWEPKERS